MHTQSLLFETSSANQVKGFFKHMDGRSLKGKINHWQGKVNDRQRH